MSTIRSDRRKTERWRIVDERRVNIFVIVRSFFLLSALLFSGCAGSTDVSSNERFRTYVGQTATLRRPMLLVKHSDYFFGGSNDVMSARSVRYGMTEPGTYSAPRVFAELPPGHRVTIDAVRDEVCVDAYQTVVYGHTTLPDSGKEGSFAYLYSASQPLPWEP